VLGNHDRSRIATRIGEAQARLAALLLLTLRGTPTLYYGDEIGMKDVPIAPELARDPWGKNVPGLGLGRDPERTPMQWSPGLNAGFSKATPWLPVAADAERVNVEVQRSDPTSLLSFYRSLLAVRRAQPALAIGSYQELVVSPNVLSFERAHGEQRLAIALNFSSQAQALTLQTPSAPSILLSSDPGRSLGGVGSQLSLGPNEGVILRLPT